MSKKYDEFRSNDLKKANSIYMTDGLISMFRDIDKDLDREIRDRAIIALVKKSIQEGKELTYGDIRLLIDDDPSEKEYENEKENHHTR